MFRLILGVLAIAVSSVFTVGTVAQSISEDNSISPFRKNLISTNALLFLSAGVLTSRNSRFYVSSLMYLSVSTMLRFLLLMLVIAVYCSFSSTMAQTKSNNGSSWPIHKNIISTNALFLGFGIYNVAYERALSNKITLSIDAYCTLKNHEPDLYDHTGFFITHGKARLYPFGKSPKGFFAGGYFSYGSFTFETNPYSYYDDTGSGLVSVPSLEGYIHSISFGPEIGYKFLIIERISLEIALGCGPNFHSEKNDIFNESVLSEDLLPYTGINVGYAFK